MRLRRPKKTRRGLDEPEDRKPEARGGLRSQSEGRTDGKLGTFGSDDRAHYTNAFGKLNEHDDVGDTLALALVRGMLDDGEAVERCPTVCGLPSVLETVTLCANRQGWRREASQLTDCCTGTRPRSR